MCDTFVALSHVTRDGSVIFGKNSDREPNEAQALLMIPHTTHPADAWVDCTYIRVPQVRETYALLLSKPFWIWGAEMGANEKGVVIGNEAVFTKVPYDKEPGLIGMDFLRLALERAATADEALDVIIDLLETHGQGGNCGMDHKLYYHNGFLIADPNGAWVLETAGKHWAAEKVRDVRSISNVISIGAKWDRASDDLVSHAIDQGWCKSPDEFHFGKCYSDLIYTTFSDARHRLWRTDICLWDTKGEIDVPFAMSLLRDHGPDAGEKWQPGRGLLGAEVCMHASFGPVRGSQTTGSMVSHLTPDRQTHWVTGTAAPCTSVFKPVWLDAGLPDLGPLPEGEYDQSTLWWRHENLHREILRDYSGRIRVLEPDQSAFERDIIMGAEALDDLNTDERRTFSRACFDRAGRLEMTWQEKVHAKPIRTRRPLLDRWAWRKFDRRANRTG
jgi:dipeptidase